MMENVFKKSSREKLYLHIHSTMYITHKIISNFQNNNFLKPPKDDALDN